MQTHEPVIDSALSDDNSVLRFIQINKKSCLEILEENEGFGRW